MRAILLLYCDRSKIIKIPDYNPENHLTYLEREFRKLFLFEGNVAIHVSFQKFCPKWEEYVELDEDEVLDPKDKLKVVVTSRIVTPPSSLSWRAVEIEENSITPGVSETDSLCVLNRGVNQITKEGENNFSSLPSTSTADESLTCENDSDDAPLPPPICKRPHRQAFGTDDNYDEFISSNMEKSDENRDVCIKKKKIEKLEEDAVPLPDPFPLPKHYSAEVEAALRATKMTNVTRRAFIGKIAAAML